MPVANPAAASASAIDTVFEALLGDIMRGTYPSGSRLPAERELSRIVGASRPTLREALRRLGEWNLVTARRGSGIVVRDRRDWTIEVLPSYLRYGGVATEVKSLGRFLGDLLLLRRGVMLSVLGMLRGRLPRGGTASARLAVEKAWAARTNGVEFVQADFGVMRALVEAAELLPPLWTINRLAFVYLDLARTVAAHATPPDDYFEVHTLVLDRLEAGDIPGAETTLAGYLDRHDARLLGILGLTL